MPQTIPIKAAQDVGEEYGCQQVILAMFDGVLTHIVTWGKSTEDCAQAATGGNRIKEALGWPADLKDQPSRVKAILQRVAEAQEKAGAITYEKMLEIANAQ